jgi:hypothetical protein
MFAVMLSEGPKREMRSMRPGFQTFLDILAALRSRNEILRFTQNDIAIRNHLDRLFVFFVITVAAAEVAVGLTGLLLTDLGREFNS